MHNFHDTARHNTEVTGAMTASFGATPPGSGGLQRLQIFCLCWIASVWCDARVGFWHDGHLQGAMLHRRGIALTGGVSLFFFSLAIGNGKYPRWGE